MCCLLRVRFKFFVVKMNLRNRLGLSYQAGGRERVSSADQKITISIQYPIKRLYVRGVNEYKPEFYTKKDDIDKKMQKKPNM
jgi:hypothetical protein